MELTKTYSVWSLLFKTKYSSLLKGLDATLTIIMFKVIELDFARH